MNVWVVEAGRNLSMMCTTNIYASWDAVLRDLPHVMWSKMSGRYAAGYGLGMYYEADIYEVVK